VLAWPERPGVSVPGTLMPYTGQGGARYREGMAEFLRADLHGSRFERVDLAGAELRAVDLSGAVFRGVDLTGVVMRGVELVNADIYGEIVNLTVNDVDIGPLVEAGPGWPRPRSYPVRECLLCILNEEWEHRLYAERDLGILEARRPDGQA
jgi:pentapeptide repeat protein